MKYFTMELLNRFRSDDEDVSALAHDEWEAALKQCHQREERIKAALPEGARRFLDAHFEDIGRRSTIDVSAAMEAEVA